MAATTYKKYYKITCYSHILLALAQHFTHTNAITPRRAIPFFLPSTSFLFFFLSSFFFGDHERSRDLSRRDRVRLRENRLCPARFSRRSSRERDLSFYGVREFLSLSLSPSFTCAFLKYIIIERSLRDPDASFRVRDRASTCGIGRTHRR